ncbi:MAG: ABC transporter ATP-binding protein [Archangiaceae bacterium]|nr:ABC transporter ATP-binding protein [Archangiaceae bacterium]
MSAVELKQLRKAFGTNPIVKGVDLHVEAGEFLVMVGPSGCGKSTLLRLIAGLETADSGEIVFDGRRVNDLPPRDRDVGMVFQSYALYPHMTVRENLAFGLTLRGMPPAEIERRVGEAAQMLELQPLLQRRPKELSGGQRQRVAMGRVIVRRPKLFLFDEPLSNLDTALRVQMRGELATLHRRLGTTMIYVTHDQVEAMTLATRVAVFNGGVLQQLGPPLELYHRPANRFVAQFLGSPSMNVLPARRDGALIKGAGFELAAPPGLEAGGEVLVGLRPQDLQVGADGPLSGTVTSVERLGFDGYAYLSSEAGALAARFEGEIEVGAKVKVRAVGDALHVFSADGAAALRHPLNARAH